MKTITLYFVKDGSSLYKLANERTLEYVCVASTRETEVGTYLIRPNLYRRENGMRVHILVNTLDEGLDIVKGNASRYSVRVYYGKEEINHEDQRV